MTDEELLIEVCHDLVNRALLNEEGDDSSWTVSHEHRAKERAIRNIVAERDQLRAEVDRMRAGIAAFAETVQAASTANLRRGQGGQQVQFHGDFANANPGTLSRLEWWARHMTDTYRAGGKS